MRYLSVLLVICSFVSCTNQTSFSQIDLDKDMTENVSVKLSEMVSHLEYIRLETDSNCLIGDNFQIAVLENEILSFNRKKCLWFDRKTGKFVKEILHSGKDIDGYMSTMVGKGMVANEEKRYIFLKEWNGNISTYFIDTNTKKSISYTDFGSVAYLNDTVLVATSLNLDGKQINRMWIYDNYVCVDSIPTTQTFELKSNAIAFLDNEDLFYRAEGKTYYKHMMNDTVYQVTADALIPRYFFYSNEKSPTIELKGHPESMYELMKDMYVVSKIIETDYYILYEIAYQEEKHYMAYNKNTGKGGRLEEGVVNDIDNGSVLWPDHLTAKGEYVFVLNPSSLNESELNRYNLKEDDNALVIIGN